MRKLSVIALVLFVWLVNTPTAKELEFTVTTHWSVYMQTTGWVLRCDSAGKWTFFRGEKDATAELKDPKIWDELIWPNYKETLFPVKYRHPGQQI